MRTTKIKFTLGQYSRKKRVRAFGVRLIWVQNPALPSAGRNSTVTQAIWR